MVVIPDPKFKEVDTATKTLFPVTNFPPVVLVTVKPVVVTASVPVPVELVIFRVDPPTLKFPPPFMVSVCPFKSILLVPLEEPNVNPLEPVTVKLVAGLLLNCTVPEPPITTKGIDSVPPAVSDITCVPVPLKVTTLLVL